MKQILAGQFDAFVTGAEMARILGLTNSAPKDLEWYTRDVQYITIAGNRYYRRDTVEDAAAKRAAWKARHDTPFGWRLGD